MKIYKCIITGDELFSDAYPIEFKDGIYKLKGKYVTRKEGDVDDRMIGGNASAEEQVESSEAATVSGVNVVLDNRLEPTVFGTKKEFVAYFKTLVGKLKEIKGKDDPKFLEDEAKMKEWQTQIQEDFKKLGAKFKDFEFFTGVSHDPEGTMAFVSWEAPKEGEDEVPYVYFFSASIREEKV